MSTRQKATRLVVLFLLIFTMNLCQKTFGMRRKIISHISKKFSKSKFIPNVLAQRFYSQDIFDEIINMLENDIVDRNASVYFIETSTGKFYTLYFLSNRLGRDWVKNIIAKQKKDGNYCFSEETLLIGTTNPDDFEEWKDDDI